MTQPATPVEHEYLAGEEWESWTAVLMLSRMVLRDLDASLRKAHDLTVTEFDVLITLFNAPGARMHMSELSKQAMLSTAGVSHLVTRLERDGLLQRELDPADRRRSFAILTAVGDAVLRRARPTHNEVLRRTILTATSPEERALLRRLWARMGGDGNGT